MIASSSRLIFTGFFLLSLLSVSYAASDYLLEIEGVTGESKKRGHEGHIEISSYSWGLSQTSGGSSGGGGGAGKVSFQDLHFKAPSSRAGPPLFLAAASGQHFPKATLRAFVSGSESTEPYLKVTLTDIVISSFQQSGDDDNDGVTGARQLPTSPTDAFSLNFAKITFDRAYINAAGGKSVQTAGWDLATNKKV